MSSSVRRIGVVAVLTLVLLAAWQSARAVNHYLDVLQENLPRSTRIVVLGPPWGTLDQLGRHRLTKIVYAAAKAHHVQYVSTMGTLDRRERVLDGIHPNRAGSRALADRVIAALEK